VGGGEGESESFTPIAAKSITHPHPPRLALENVQEEDGQPCGAFWRHSGCNYLLERSEKLEDAPHPLLLLVPIISSVYICCWEWSKNAFRGAGSVRGGRPRYQRNWYFWCVFSLSLSLTHTHTHTHTHAHTHISHRFFLTAPPIYLLSQLPENGFYSWAAKCDPLTWSVLVITVATREEYITCLHSW
jgi:hypothetical protein